MAENLGFNARLTPVEHQDPEKDSASQRNLPGMTREKAVSLNLLCLILIGTVISCKSMHKAVQLQTNSKTYNSCNFSKQLIHERLGIKGRLPSNQLG